MKETFYIIDGHSQIHRCYHAPFRELTGPNGEPTRATFVFCRFLFKLIQEQQPDFLAMAIDTDRRKLKRKEWYPKYKANRGDPKPDLFPQIKRICQIVKALGIPIISAEGWEADDVIAGLISDSKQKSIRHVIVGRDKDLMQLVKDGEVKMYDPLGDEWIDEAWVTKRWGVPPRKLLDLFTLIGDSGDNVPGIRGIGEKIGVRLIKDHGSIDQIYDVAKQGKLTPALSRNIVHAISSGSVMKTRKLIRLNTQVDYKATSFAWRWEGLKLDRVRRIFRGLGFRQFEREFNL